MSFVTSMCICFHLNIHTYIHTSEHRKATTTETRCRELERIGHTNEYLDVLLPAYKTLEEKKESFAGADEKKIGELGERRRRGPNI